MKEVYLQTACEQTEVTIRAIGDMGENKQIYCGILEDMRIQHENGLCLMEIRIAPYTYLMDLKPERRSFQNPSMTYQDVLDCIAAQYAGGNILMNVGSGTAIGGTNRTVSGDGLGSLSNVWQAIFMPL